MTRTVICPRCREPFTRYGGAQSSSFYLTAEENDTCVCCKFGLDPETLQPKIPRPVEAEKS